MNELSPPNLHAFLKRFQLRGGRLQRIVLRTRADGTADVEIRLVVRDSQTNQPVPMRMSFANVEEYRFQRRPNSGLIRLKDVQFGFFDELVYVNFDAFPEDGPPKVMDFRASDCFVGAGRLNWEVVKRKIS